MYFGMMSAAFDDDCRVLLGVYGVRRADNEEGMSCSPLYENFEKYALVDWKPRQLH